MTSEPQVDLDELRRAAMAMIHDLRTGDAVPGVPIGERAPDFVLPDANGGKVALRDRLAAGPVVVSFYRGAWCPYCNTELRALQGALDDITARGTSLVAISPQAPDASLPLVEQLELGFDVLSDLDQTVSRAYSLQFELAPALRATYPKLGMDLTQHNADGSWHLPVPATFVLDTDGIVRARHVDPNYLERMPVDDILTALDGIT
ncbi:MAG: peroxiredoxin-like family protein [Acidimicrobiales bacterium]